MAHHHKNSDGWIYFIVCEETQRVKIGWAYAPSARFEHVRQIAPTKLRLVTAIRGTVEYEHEMHRRFADHCYHGEWFALAPEIQGIMHWLLEEYGAEPWKTGEKRRERRHMPSDYSDTEYPAFRQNLRKAFVREVLAGRFDLMERKVRLRYRKELKEATRA